MCDLAQLIILMYYIASLLKWPSLPDCQLYEDDITLPNLEGFLIGLPLLCTLNFSHPLGNVLPSA